MTTTDASRRLEHGWGWTLALALILGGVMVWALPRQIQAGDAGEFATIMLRGGVPHPSGYPWMRLLGWPARLFEALGMPPATAAALPCGLCGIGGWLVLHRVIFNALRPTGHRLTPALVTFVVLWAGLGSTVVLHVNDSEVWGPLILGAALVLRAALTPCTSPWQLGLWLGIAISHHLTAALLIPVVIGAATPADPRSFRMWLRTASRGIAGGLLGLTPTLTLAVVSPEPAWVWGDTTTLAGWLHHLTRGDYGMLSLSLHHAQVPVWALWERVMVNLGHDWSGGLIHGALGGTLLMLGMLGMSLGSRPASIRRTTFTGLWLSAVASCIGFPALHNIDPTSPHSAWILERFDMLTTVLFVPLVAATLDRRLAVVNTTLARVGLAVLALLLGFRQLVATAWLGVPAENPLIERYAHDLLLTPEPGRRAVVFGTDDHRTFPVLFVQEVLGVGSHVTYIDASLLAHPWYRARIERQFPGLPVRPKPIQTINAIRQTPQFDNVDLYIANVFSRPAAALPTIPVGVLLLIAAPDDRDTRELDTVVRRHQAALHRFMQAHGRAMPIETPSANHPFAADLLSIYPRLTRDIAERLRDVGRTSQGEALLREALTPSPRSPPP